MKVSIRNLKEFKTTFQDYKSRLASYYGEDEKPRLWEFQVKIHFLLTFYFHSLPPKSAPFLDSLLIYLWEQSVLNQKGFKCGDCIHVKTPSLKPNQTKLHYI